MDKFIDLSDSAKRRGFSVEVKRDLARDVWQVYFYNDRAQYFGEAPGLLHAASNAYRQMHESCAVLPNMQ